MEKKYILQLWELRKKTKNYIIKQMKEKKKRQILNQLNWRDFIYTILTTLRLNKCLFKTEY